MSTNSRIGFVDPKTNLIHSIYCNFDGYVSGVGKTLRDHYKDLKKIRSLIALGSISCREAHLSPRTAPRPWLDRHWSNPKPLSKHTFDDPIRDVTVVYHRDHGEPWNTVEPITESVMKADKEYNYLYKAGQWYVKCYKTDWVAIPDGDLTRFEVC